MQRRRRRRRRLAMDRHAMGRRLDRRRPAGHRKDRRRHHRPVHRDRVDRTSPSDGYYSKEMNPQLLSSTSLVDIFSPEPDERTTAC